MYWIYKSLTSLNNHAVFLSLTKTIAKSGVDENKLIFHQNDDVDDEHLAVIINDTKTMMKVVSCD